MNYLHVLILASFVVAVITLTATPILLGRHLALRQHREQFRATGAPIFDLPSDREIEREQVRTEPLAAVTEPLPHVLIDTDTGETIRVGPDGEPLSAADIAARTPPTVLTVDRERLAEVLQLEETGEYTMNPATWVECDAAEQFMRDPLGSALLPPPVLVEDAGNPHLADVFWSLIRAGGLTTDWKSEDSEFHFWDQESKLALVS